MIATSSKEVRLKEGGINVYDFCQHAKFRDPDYPADITQEMRSMLKDMHPSKIIAVGVLGLTVYRVEYQYTTNRNNYKTGEKYFFLKEGDAINFIDPYEREIMIEGLLQNHFSDFNRQYPYRAVSNVKILDIVTYAHAELNIG